MEYRRYDYGAILYDIHSDGGSEYASDLMFPIEAYKKFLEKSNLPFPSEWKSQESEAVQKALPPKEFFLSRESAPDDMTVAEGITVGQLRGLLDEKNEGKTFCPVLLA